VDMPLEHVVQKVEIYRRVVLRYIDLVTIFCALAIVPHPSLHGPCTLVEAAPRDRAAGQRVD